MCDIRLKLTILSTGETFEFNFSDLEADDYGIFYNAYGWNEKPIYVSGNGRCYNWEENNYINPDIKLEVIS